MQPGRTKTNVVEGEATFALTTGNFNCETGGEVSKGAKRRRNLGAFLVVLILFFPLVSLLRDVR